MPNLYLVHYELKFVHRKLKFWNQISRGLQILLLNYYRYIDDIFTPPPRTGGVVLENSYKEHKRRSSFSTVGNDLKYQDVLYFDGESDRIYPKRLKNLDGPTVENPFQVNDMALAYADYFELEFELELMQSHMAQKPMLRGEVGAVGSRN